MERNRRVAKAYARAIPIQINGSDDGFDGFRYTFFSIFSPFYSGNNYDRSIYTKPHTSNHIKINKYRGGNFPILLAVKKKCVLASLPERMCEVRG